MLKKKEEKGFFSKKNIMSLIIVFIMVSSILAIWQGSQDPNEVPSYNDYDVSLDDTRTYRIDSDYGDVYGYSYPTALESIALDPAFVQYLLSSSSIVVLFDPIDPMLPYVEVLRKELAREDLSLFSKTASFGITQANESYSYPVVSCATTIEPTLFLRTDNMTTTRIYQDTGCIVLEAQTWEELVYLKDRVVYTLAGIMD
ncbi:MAG: hypothetical protein AABX98_04300 [Nanoarchaeota archaeon]